MKTRQFLEYPIFFLSINMKENKVKTLAFLSAIFGLKQTTLKQTHSPSQDKQMAKKSGFFGYLYRYTYIYIYQIPRGECNTRQDLDPKC